MVPGIRKIPNFSMLYDFDIFFFFFSLFGKLEASWRFLNYVFSLGGGGKGLMRGELLFPWGYIYYPQSFLVCIIAGFFFQNLMLLADGR